MRSIFALVIGLILISPTTRAWVYPEHRDIAVLAVLDLDSARRATLNQLWEMARVGHEERLPAFIVIPHLPEQPRYIDWAAWPAIGGDHSCSPSQMLETILYSDWIMDVARITEHFKRELASARDKSDRVNALRDQDLSLQRADPQYATRAGSNNVHFLLPREHFLTDAEEFILASLVQGDEINALGVYIWYHYRALAKMNRLRSEALSDAQRSQLALAALADEAYGLHFLEDTYAAGHVAGTWGSASLRKGTHDYYNEHGLETTTWGGEPVILMGDAYMRQQDGKFASRAVRHSLEQLVDCYLGKEPYVSHYFNPDHYDGLELMTADTLNTCSNTDLPGRTASRELVKPLVEIIEMTPVPALKAGEGELPRFRTELGPFIGFAPFMRGHGFSGGFAQSEENPGGVGSIGVNLRVGLGLDGVTSEAGDGLVFLDVGITQDNASTNSFLNDLGVEAAGSIVSAIPARSSLSTRIRMPFWLLPGDLILGGLLIAPFSLETFTEMAVVAGNGGLLPWQAGLATPIGRLQLILGREVGVNFYGLGTPDRVFVNRGQGDDVQLEILEFKSLQLEFPILELRPFRTFSIDQSSAAMLQFYMGWDIPQSWTVITDPAFDPNLRSLFLLGIRGVFDWRYYF